MKLEPESETAKAIEELIASETSPVGIDAKKTHVLILAKLVAIEARLTQLEKALEEHSQKH